MGSCTMQPFFGIPLGVLLALVAKSCSLSCIQCSSETSTSCTGSSVSCSSGSLCTVIYTVQSIGNSSLTSYTMTCAPRTQCDVNGTIGITGSNIKMASSCCSTDNCIPYLPSLPADSSVSNGLRCRSCISSYSTWCYSLSNIQCTGNETMCLLRSKTQSGSQPMALRGCATKSICDLKSQSYKVNGVSTNIEYICTSGGNVNSFCILTVACILLLKLLF
ncbi:phospholipase A2 inhibitor and Ly6/PLAUR domain-containing protein-like [Lithobates pipiens]